MPKPKIKSLGADARYRGRISVGCRQCAKGRKMVLFITGRCDFHCFYCPISERRRGTDTIWANERQITDDADGISAMLEEARLINAQGTGITGGDPIKVLDRTARYIKILKKEFGKKHHIHLYTATPVDERQIKLLDDAGLDELRIQVPPEIWDKFDGSRYHDSLTEIQKSSITPAVEVPILPDKKADMKKLILALDKLHLPFINLNELEISETNIRALEERGYTLREDSIVGVAGSMQAGLEMLKTPAKMGINVCTSRYKDAVQLRNRLIQRAGNIVRDFEIITEDGTIIRGIIETGDLGGTAKILENDFGLKKRDYAVDIEKERIELGPEMAEKIAQKTHLVCFIIENYPTCDALEVERIPL